MAKKTVQLKINSLVSPGVVTSTPVEIVVFPSVKAALVALGNDEVLRCINYAHRLETLRNARELLVTTARVSKQ